ncbi:MAG: ATP phosphoribosyltransferase [Acidimicrobiia bacterium]
MISTPTIHMALPKGRMESGVFALFRDAGMDLRVGQRGYRPVLSESGFEVKLLKPQNIVEMLASGTRDIGFAGADWVAEKQADLVELLDTGLDPVRIVAAVPEGLLEGNALPGRRLVVASEYERLAKQWIADRSISAHFVHSYGATEVFPPEDADVIIDNTATGETLAANGLVVVDVLLTSSTRLYASQLAMTDPTKKEPIDDLVLGLRSVLEARRRVMLECNVPLEDLEAIIANVPAMREPTVAPLHGGKGMAVKAAVPRDELPRLIPLLKQLGASDIAVTRLDQIVP